MASSSKSRIPDVVRKHEDSLLEEWLKGLMAGGRINAAELRQQCSSFLNLLLEGMEAGADLESLSGPAWEGMRELLQEVSTSRTLKGFSPSETATFVLSFKKPFFARLNQELSKQSDLLAEETWNASTLLDQMGLFTTEAYQRTREQIINRQQQEMLELSTPVVKLWEGILALPIIGTLDSARTQVVMETLLQMIVAHSAEIAIIDITGVPTVDTLVAQHLIKTVTAARLMGADCIISGIRPQIAQTIVHLGVDLTGVMTKATMADALRLALQRRGLSITRATTTASK